VEPEHDLIRQRKKKLAELREMGVDPYPARFRPTDRAGDLIREAGHLSGDELASLDRRALAAGRVIALRKFGKTAFSHLQDGGDRIQIYFRRDSLSEKDVSALEKLDLGDIIGVEGKLFKTRTGELTTEVATFRLLAKSLRPLPEKWHGLRDIEQRYRQRYLDLIVNPTVREVFLTRAALVAAIREFFTSRDFLEVETPMMQPIPGGAAARPFRTFYNALDQEVFLRVAPELYLKRLVIGGFDRVFEINRNFRNEGLSREHNPEFTMLEFYQAYSDYRDLMGLTEELLVELARKVTGSERLPYQGKEIDLSPPWPRLRLTESLSTVAGLEESQVRDEKFLRRRAQELEIPHLEKYGLPQGGVAPRQGAPGRARSGRALRALHRRQGGGERLLGIDRPPRPEGAFPAAGGTPGGR
jgi:lysyl-tRNA synthetase class 2